MFKNLLKTLAGNPYEREIQRYTAIVEQINSLEPEMQARSDEELRTVTDDLRDQIQEALADFDEINEDNREAYLAAEREVLNSVLPVAFAAVREAAVRTIGLRHYDVQLIGGIVLHEGKIAEMKTGEGKTLVASLPLYLNALTGRGAHLVTVNDYLARRDGGWMGPIFNLLGLATSVIGKEQYSAIYDIDYVDPGGDLEDERLVHWRTTLRSECYQADITYGTASEFGFDYLRDNTTTDATRLVQRAHVYAIVDEVDSVLIDGARTPLIISGPAGKASSTYQAFAQIVDKARLRRTRNVDQLEFEEPDGDYILDDRTQTVSLTDQGIEKIESMIPEIDTEKGESLYDPQYYELVHYLENAMKAKFTFKRDKDYFVQNGRVILIDQTTGRPMPSRRYSEGLHQAIEAKEGVNVRREDITIATITVQNYFRLYDKLSGMTGTAVTQSEEFEQVYQLDVIAIPTNVSYRAENGIYETQKSKVGDILPSLASQEGDENVSMTGYIAPEKPGVSSYFKRVDFPDQVYQSINGKFESVSREIAEVHRIGRPILVGTGSVESSEVLSTKLKKLGLAHEVLNAKNHQREALIIAQAGRSDSITISTSMAGRGTDILLGGNPEGLAAKYLADNLFDLTAFQTIVADIVKENMDDARQKARASASMDDALVDWIIEENEELIRKANVDDVLVAVINDIREEPAYKGIPYDTLVQIIQQIELSSVVTARMERARQLAEEAGAPLSILPDLQYRLNEYRSLGGMMGETGQIETVARRLFEKHYNARAALVRAVLADNPDEALRLTKEIPGLPASLIGDVQKIREDCRSNREDVWSRGGLHVIGTERHEARRIDDQLRGRAARQGDPGSSRFYLSLEDELMLRFGGERTKRLMERLNIPEDMPISANMLSNALEQAQGRFESYHFEIRKNLVEYDEAVNRQREIVYDERQSILRGDVGELDELVSRFMERTLERLIDRLRDNYEAWALNEVQTFVTDFSNIETGEVNTRGVVQRILPLIPRSSTQQLQSLLEITDSEDLVEEIHELLLDGIDAGHNIRMLMAEVTRIVPVWPLLPAVTPHGIEGWSDFVARLEVIFHRYGQFLSEASADELWTALSTRLEKIWREALAGISQSSSFADVKGKFHGQLSAALVDVFQGVLGELESEDLVEVLLERVNDLMSIARMSPLSSKPEAEQGEIDRSLNAERRVFAIGEDQLVHYERALMLSVIDGEWRQYLTAINDLRQAVGLEAFGQRDPKVEFKRRAFEMFDTLRADVEENIARRFFAELPRHRQIVEAQKRDAAQLDNLAQLGYRVERKVSRSKDGKRQVSQTVHKNLWSNVGRNDPCPCGSGKKFKDCHYRVIQQQQQTVGQSEIVRSSGRKRGRRR